MGATPRKREVLQIKSSHIKGLIRVKTHSHNSSLQKQSHRYEVQERENANQL